MTIEKAIFYAYFEDEVWIKPDIQLKLNNV
jgi:hypothetical protein